jgi:hypothetical protein
VHSRLQDAAFNPVNLLKSDCPTYRAFTPVVRLEAMEQRLNAMLRAVQTVQPALERCPPFPRRELPGSSSRAARANAPCCSRPAKLQDLCNRANDWRE